MKAVYIHIPFCKKICSYCDFCKVYYYKKWIKPYLLSLEKEIKTRYQGEKINTLYIGGGSPSSLSISELNFLFSLLQNFNLSKLKEFTFECNIEDLTKEKIELLIKNKVNRLSIGVQTFNQKHLSFLKTFSY
ncbi:MAG: radical SAM protein [Bacilli bacterium]